MVEKKIKKRTEKNPGSSTFNLFIYLCDFPPGASPCLRFSWLYWRHWAANWVNTHTRAVNTIPCVMLCASLTLANAKNANNERLLIAAESTTIWQRFHLIPDRIQPVLALLRASIRPPTPGTSWHSEQHVISQRANTYTRLHLSPLNNKRNCQHVGTEKNLFLRKTQTKNNENFER